MREDRSQKWKKGQDMMVQRPEESGDERGNERER